MQIKHHLTLLILLFTSKILGQGHNSDAGLCSIGTLQPISIIYKDSSNCLYPYSVKLTEGFSIGEQGVQIWQTIPEVNIGFGKIFNFQAKVPFTSTNGNLGKSNAFGDVSIALSSNFKLNNDFIVTATLGTKIPTNYADLTEDVDIKFSIKSPNFPIAFPITITLPFQLPMAYQTSLGTYDIIGGLSFVFRKWNFATGFQIPLSNQNQNAYIPISEINKMNINYNGTSIKATAPFEWGNYFNSAKLKRGSDAMLRIEKLFRIKKFDFSSGLLAIYRIGGDKYSPNLIKETKIAGSEGITLNVTGGIKCRLSKKIDLDWLMSFPVVVRKVRADGLTRAFTTSISINYSFAFKKKVTKRFNLNSKEVGE